MITKRLSSNVDSITSDRIDTVSKRRNISADEATNTDTYFSYALPTGSLLVHEDVIDYETQLALREKWNYWCDIMMVFVKELPLDARKD